MSHITVQPGFCCHIPHHRRIARTGLAAAWLLALAACTAPNVGTDVLTTGMPNPEVALRDGMRLVDAEMTSLGTLGARGACAVNQR